MGGSIPSLSCETMTYQYDGAYVATFQHLRQERHRNDSTYFAKTELGDLDLQGRYVYGLARDSVFTGGADDAPARADVADAIRSTMSHLTNEYSPEVTSLSTVIVRDDGTVASTGPIVDDRFLKTYEDDHQYVTRAWVLSQLT